MDSRQAFVKSIHDNESSILCVPQEKITDSTDPNDNKFLEVAIECGADYLITGGDKKHLLPLHPYRNIQILQPHDFLTIALETRA